MTKNIQPHFLVFLIFSFALPSFAQKVYNPHEKQEKIEGLLQKYVDYEQFNGSILVAHEGKLLYKKGFGMSNFELETPNTTLTKHRLASMTKQFTAMLIVQLAAEKKLELHVPISKYLPNYPKKNANQITIHHLLTHSSGTMNYTNFPNYRDLMRTHKTPEELVELFADSALIFKPGDRIYYSNSGYVLLGVIIEKITGKTYAEVLQEKIFDPLGMKNSGYENSRDVLKNRASGYYGLGGKLQIANYIDMSVAYSAGGLYSTVEDLFIWDQALYTDKIVNGAFLKLLFMDHFPMYGGAYYGYGWEMEDMTVGNSKRKVETISHSGVINGFTSLITRIPDTKTTIILLNNTSQAPLTHITRAISGIIYQMPYNMPKQSIAKLLLKTINESGLESGISLYEKTKISKEHYITESELNETGYELMWAKKLVEAKAIFELVIEAYPDSFNAYDSYAEALMQLGETKKSIQNYKKSLELNPKNTNATDMLKKLEK